MNTTSSPSWLHLKLEYVIFIEVLLLILILLLPGEITADAPLVHRRQRQPQQQQQQQQQRQRQQQAPYYNNYSGRQQYSASGELPPLTHVGSDITGGLLLVGQCPAAPTARFAPYPSGTTIELKCPDNYELVGVPRATCNEQGQWNAAALGHCRPRRTTTLFPRIRFAGMGCEPPKTPRHALIFAQSRSLLAGADRQSVFFTTNGWIRYVCKSGYKPDKVVNDETPATVTIYCNSNGSWSANPPKCRCIDSTYCGGVTPYYPPEAETTAPTWYELESKQSRLLQRNAKSGF